MVTNRQNLYENRRDAGRSLADRLGTYRDKDVLVLGIPRGGIPVAAPVAEQLDAELDVIVVKKLGAPGNPELAIGAIGEGEEPYLNDDVVASLSVDQGYVTREAGEKNREVKELLTEFRSVKDRSLREDRTVILVDDGIATGATTRACLEIINRDAPEELVLAVPVAPVETLADLREEAPVDRIVCPHEIEGFFGGIGGYYRDFTQVSTEQVRKTLKTFNDRDTGTEEPKSDSTS